MCTRLGGLYLFELPARTNFALELPIEGVVDVIVISVYCSSEKSPPVYLMDLELRLLENNRVEWILPCRLCAASSNDDSYWMLCYGTSSLFYRNGKCHFYSAAAYGCLKITVNSRLIHITSGMLMSLRFATLCSHLAFF